MIFKKLQELKDNDIIKSVYQCKECGYIINKPIMKEEINLYLENPDKYKIFHCHNCSEKTMEIIEVWSEEDWLKTNKYAG